jgi:hypothetical protein
MESQGSLARIDPSRVRVTPKTHFAARGITIRSLSRYLALNYESIDVQWRRIAPARWSAEDRQEYNLVLLPWPLVVRAEDFRPVEGPLENMDPTAFGFFEFDPKVDLDIDLVAGVIRQARRKVRRVHALVMPEGAVKVEEIPAVERILARHGVAFLITGVREATTEQRLGSNYLHLGVFTKDGWQHYRQAKHHRWCLDGSQIRQYHLSRALDPSRLWWEAIDLPIRTAQIIDIGNGATIAPLVCEDLARLDEVADLLRRVGPSLVVTLLLDGPQLPQRWPCRYATVLADEPGSAVLTLTSSGMASRSTPANKSRSRATAMWSDPQTGLRQIELGRGAKALLLTAAVEPKTVWTADGRRHHDNTPSVTLTAVQQLRVSERD